MTTKATIYDRPDMEYPVYLVVIAGMDFFIQRQEGMNPGDTAWYQKVKNDNYWDNVGEYCLGWTKKEAIEYLEKQF